MSERQGTNIKIEGVKATIKALKEFEPDLQKAMNKEIRSALTMVREGAKSRYPKGAWSLRLNTKNILGTVIATGGGSNWDGKNWSDIAPGVRAAIFEFAGSVQGGRTPQARGLIDSLNRRYGTPGRFLWASWDANGRDVLDKIEAAVRSAERDLQANLDSAGEGY